MEHRSKIRQQAPCPGALRYAQVASRHRYVNSDNGLDYCARVVPDRKLAWGELMCCWSAKHVWSSHVQASRHFSSGHPLRNLSDYSQHSGALCRLLFPPVPSIGLYPIALVVDQAEKQNWMTFTLLHRKISNIVVSGSCRSAKPRDLLILLRAFTACQLLYPYRLHSHAKLSSPCIRPPRSHHAKIQSQAVVPSERLYRPIPQCTAGSVSPATNEVEQARLQLALMATADPPQHLPPRPPGASR
ncbi:hypothetical protein F5Y18DRAFT_100107 [Xylariaceae sp. FL1019]|nr:hypothetical protein F5Y18DRAFT_100107 [Xylariaceae sp. FL1019]